MPTSCSRIGAVLALAIAGAASAGAQCYQFSGAGVTLKVNIASIFFQTGPTLVAGGAQTDYVFSGTNSFTLGSASQTSASVMNGAADIQYFPSIGGSSDLTTFTVSVPNSDPLGSGSHSWVAYLAGNGNLIPSHLFPVPIPPLSLWTGVGNSDYIEVSSGASRTKYPITAVSMCTTSDPGGPGGGGGSTGSLAQVAAAGGWDTLFTAVNLGASGNAHADFYGNDGSALTLPLNLVSSGTAALTATPTPASSFDQSLGSNASAVIDATGDVTQNQVTGWSQFQTAGGMSGFGIFRYPQFKWEAVVPLETRNAGSYFLAFDNTGMLATGVAVANVATTAAHIIVIIRDDTGVQITTAAIDLPALGHTSFMLNQQYNGTNNKRGTVEFQTPGFGGQTPGRISVLGLRANGGALTTLPVLAKGDAGGGAIAHATYNGGFTSVFYIVNPGTSSADFTLNFFTENGAPLGVPLSFPQTGTATTTASLTRTLAPGAMLVVETQANDSAPSVVGSAQMTTTGSISGFEIFRWTTFGQEASVPLETRTPNSYVLVFDNIGALTTGVALSNFAGLPVNVTTKFYDDAGTPLQTTSVALTGHGHTSFMLPSNFGFVANKRGMVEFVVPAGGSLSAVGLRAKADGTLTTIPVLVR